MPRTGSYAPRVAHRPVREPEPVLSWDQVPVICTCADVAKLFHCTVEKVQRMAQAGDIPAFRLGQEWRLRKEDVMAYIEGQIMGKANGAG